MAEATETKPTTTRPSRARSGTRSATSKAASTKAATAKAETAEAPAAVETAPEVSVRTDGEKTRVQFNLDNAGSTKSYAKFTPPASSGCVGTLYVPLGTEEVKILLIGPAGAVETK